MSGDTFSLTNQTRGKTPRFDFVGMKNAVLGKPYTLSVALVTPKEMYTVMVYKRPRRLRSKVGVRAGTSGRKPSNVLAFPLSSTSGEIVLCPHTARSEAPLFHMRQQDFLAYLFIHGLLHLRGMDHGVTMEREERRFMKRFGFQAYDHTHEH